MDSRKLPLTTGTPAGARTSSGACVPSVAASAAPKLARGEEPRGGEQDCDRGAVVVRARVVTGRVVMGEGDDDLVGIVRARLRRDDVLPLEVVVVRARIRAVVDPAGDVARRERVQLARPAGGLEALRDDPVRFGHGLGRVES